MDRLTPQQFVERWAGRSLTERASAQPHFTDLCRMLGVTAPTDVREHDSNYGFEARTDISASGVHATVVDDGLPYHQITTSGSGGGPGFADVWKRGCFAWEYKRPGKHASLEDALLQLRIYSPSLGHPPLLVVCDIDRYEVHTNFPDYPIEVYRFNITELVQPSDEWKKSYPSISPLEALGKTFADPEWFKPKKTRQAITAELTSDIGDLAVGLRKAGNDPHAVAHFLMQIVFCFFAEDVGLLPKKLFKTLIQRAHESGKADEFAKKARMLFKAMERGGDYGDDNIQWFNGGLFKEVDRDPVIKIDMPRLGTLLLAAKADWNSVDPTILGTLFERSLDPDKRSQIGAHYTSRDDILLIVEPVVMQPLRRQWFEVQKTTAEWLHQRKQEGMSDKRKRDLSKKIDTAIIDFVDHLGSVRVLDPACGSGNFLFVTIQQLLDLENEVRGFAARPEIAVTFTPRVQPSQVMGIEVNDYACELARVSIWIGYLQWLHANRSSQKSPPILDPLDTIERRDAILNWADKDGQTMDVWQKGAVCLGAAEWPDADFIVGNPPFLGSKLFRKWGLSDAYVHAMYETYDLPNTSDLCCYWFEQARKAVVRKHDSRIGLLATQGIRGRENRTVLERIKSDGDIFMAWSDREWILDGAMVHVSIVGFDNGTESSRILDGELTNAINTDLSHGLDLTKRSVLKDNESIAFMGDTKGGAFDIDLETATGLLRQPTLGQVQSTDIIRPWVIGLDMTRRHRGMFIIDFGVDMNEAEAAKFQALFDYVAQHVKPLRKKNRRATYANRWWIHVEPRPALRRASKNLKRVLVTPILTKHRVFCWLENSTLPDHQLIVVARDDDFMFGALHSSVHEIWARRMGSQLREVEGGFRYTASTCFETFPLPWSPGREPVHDLPYKRIAAVANELSGLRENWLNPPEWINAIADAVDRFEDFKGVTKEALPLLRQSAIATRAAKDPRLKKRTLTNLYNERPGWLKIVHRKLDEAVFAAYCAVDPKAPHPWDPAWAEAYEPFGAGEITIIRKGKRPDSPEVIAAKEEAIAQRKAIDEKILANLLRLNQQRAGAPVAAATQRKSASKA